MEFTLFIVSELLSLCAVRGAAGAASVGTHCQTKRRGADSDMTITSRERRTGNDLFMNGDGLSTDKLLLRFSFGERFVLPFFYSSFYLS